MKGNGIWAESIKEVCMQTRKRRVFGLGWMGNGGFGGPRGDGYDIS
jgi:hypothetical protein